MIIYRSLIRSKIDYGCLVYNSANSRKLVSLEYVSNEAMRISNGCFRSTLISSLEVITEEPPLQIRRHKLSLKNYCKVISLLQIRHSNSQLQNKKPYMQKKSSPSQFAIKIQNIHTKFNSENKIVMPDFSYF